MDSFKALAILAFCAGAQSAALPQLPQLPSLPSPGANLVKPLLGNLPGLPIPGLQLPGLPAIPAVSKVSGLPSLPLVTGLPIPGVPLSGLPALPAVSGLPLPLNGVPKLPSLPLPGLPLPGLPLPGAPGLPPVPLPLPLPDLPTGGLGSVTDLTNADTLSKVVTLGTTVLELILNILSKGASLVPGAGSLSLPKLPVGALPNASLPTTSLPVHKRQLGGLGGLTGGLTGGSSPLGAVTGLTGGLTGGSSPLGAVTGVTGGLTGGSSPLGAATGVVGTVGNAVSNVPVVGGAAAPVLSTVGGLTGGSSPLSGVAGTVTGAVSSVPVVGPVVGGVVSSLPVVGGGSTPAVPAAPVNPNINALPFQGIPGADPVGAFSISVIATLLSLLKKDPLSLFAPSLPIRALVKRDLPELEARDIPELAKRQLNILPSLSSGVPGVGVGALPLSGIPGIPPDLAFLVGSIAKNIAIPGGNGLGSITNNILGVLNGVVPNFLFQLPVVQDSVPTFGVLQLLASINPSKFKDLAGLTSLASLQQASSGLSSSDIAFIRSLPSSPDPSNLITTIMTLSDNILSLTGNVSNLKAAVAVLSLKNLGLAVPGL